MAIKVARRLARHLRHTVLHPQWLLFRHERELRNIVAPNMRGLILDVGCAGQSAKHLVQEMGATYIGLDYARTATHLYGTRPDVFGDAHQLPIRSNSIDGVLLLNVMEHLRNAEVALKEVVRVLKHGGTCIVEVPFLYPLHDEPYDFQRWTRHGLSVVAERTGLQVTSLTETGKTPEAIGLLFNLALTRALIRMFARRNPFALLGLLAPLIFGMINCIAYILSILAKNSWMPTAYRAVLTKAVTESPLDK